MNSSLPCAAAIFCSPLLFELDAISDLEGERVWGEAGGGKQKTPQDGGAVCLYLLRLSRIVPTIGLALAPWRLHQVAGWS